MGCLLDALRAFGVPNAILPFAGVSFFVCVRVFRFHRVLRIEPNNTAVQKCASRSTEIAS